MPNWCQNSMSISGPTEKITELWNQIQAKGTLLEVLVPMPPEVFRGDLGPDEQAQCEQQGIPNWYEWSIENWGTKWDVDIEGLELDTDDPEQAHIMGWFESAWTPPVIAFATYGEQNPDVSILLDFMEEGQCFVGRLEVDNGEVNEDWVDYTDCTSENVLECVGEDYEQTWDLIERLRTWEED